ncbi:MAG: helicase HerA-like domain-containing protein, partial [Finegoldia magna]|nr:helicase HerA-like domain-containing protein [Finegoldia magna]
AFSPKELKAVQKVSETFRANADMNVKDEIVNLRTGEALISFLDEKGAPSITKKGLVLPPHSSFTPLSQSDVDYIVKNSDLNQKYSQSIDRESAYEILQNKLQNQIKEEPEKPQKAKKQEKSAIEDFATKSINSMLGSFTRQIGRDIARGIFGSIKKSIKF